MASWFAAMWVPEDLPGLHIVAHLYDAVVRGDHTRSSELRLWLDSYGITPKGQADRRWLRDDPAATPKQTVAPSDEAGPYAGLHLVDRGDAS